MTRSLRLLSAALALLLASCVAARAQTSTLVIPTITRSSVPLGGEWQFHPGDNPAWASPDLDDSSWVHLTLDRTPSQQGFRFFNGFAWYRRNIAFSPGQSTAPPLSLYLPAQRATYQIFWNGQLIGASGRLPDTTFRAKASPQVIPLGRASAGVLALRVWTPPFDSSAADDRGLVGNPSVGDPSALADKLTADNFHDAKQKEVEVAETLIFAQASLFALLAWWQNRRQRLLVWIALYLLASTLNLIVLSDPFPALSALNLLVSYSAHCLVDIAFWYMLLYLLELDGNRRLRAWTLALAIISLVAGFIDNLFFDLVWSSIHTHAFAVIDAIFTFGFSAPELYPLVLIAFAWRKRLNPARRAVAAAAFLFEMLFVTQHTLLQGQRFTHITLGDTVDQPLFTLAGVPFRLNPILSILLVAALAYALYRQIVDQRDRQSAIQQEYLSAQELQRVLIPESLPQLPGLALTSAYRPAQQVGGDFFQVVPNRDGGTIFLLGDVSGKGLKAAMTVSLIVGAARTFAEASSDPATILQGLNHRLQNRLTSGFATCIVLRVDPSETCTVASAGHLPPFVNGAEVDLPPALPLGLDPRAAYENITLPFAIDDRITLYTDGLLEARNPQTGELFGFDRLRELLATQPDAAQASDAAVSFGQDDDITVLTLTRLATGITSTTTLSAPALAELASLGVYD